MSITIKNVLSLSFFEEARIISGRNGLENTVNRVNFSDCPIIGDELDNRLIHEGDLFINSFYMLKNKSDKLLEAVKYYYSQGSAGLFITDEYISALPAETAEFSNERGYPIVIIPRELSYAEIISRIMEMIISDQSNTIAELKVTRLLEGSVKNQEVVDTARSLNKGFRKNYLTIFARCTAGSRGSSANLAGMVRTNEMLSAISYRGDLLVVVNYDNPREREHGMKYLKTCLLSHDRNYKMGVSGEFSAIEDFIVSLRQSRSSIEMSEVISDSLIYYENLRLYKLLHPLRDTTYAREYYDEIVRPIKEYDCTYKSELYPTVVSYMDNDMDYRKTAEKLHQHENTIRYRISKIRKILGLTEEMTKFIEQISIGIKVDKILSIRG